MKRQQDADPQADRPGVEEGARLAADAQAHEIPLVGDVWPIRRTVLQTRCGEGRGRLPGLPPRQTIVSFPHMIRPLLVAVDPAQSELLLVD